MKYKKLPDKKAYKIILEYIGITIGCILLALSVTAFNVPNKIAPGGVTGLATVIFYITRIPVGVTILLINIPLFITGLKILGKNVGIKTLYGTILSSVLIDYVLPTTPFTTDLLLASVFGGIVLGLGLGIVFRFGGTTGGTDLAASIIHRYLPNFTIANILMAVDFIVILLAGLVFRQVEISLYSMISLFVSIKVIDFAQEGLGHAKAFYIISSHPEEISSHIIRELDRGVTSLKAQGMYTKEERQVLLCIVQRAQVNRVKEIVRTVDPRAFIILTEAHEVLGEGFKENPEN